MGAKCSTPEEAGKAPRGRGRLAQGSLRNKEVWEEISDALQAIEMISVFQCSESAFTAEFEMRLSGSPQRWAVTLSTNDLKRLEANVGRTYTHRRQRNLPWDTAAAKELAAEALALLSDGAKPERQRRVAGLLKLDEHLLNAVLQQSKQPAAVLQEGMMLRTLSRQGR